MTVTRNGHFVCPECGHDITSRDLDLEFGELLVFVPADNGSIVLAYEHEKDCIDCTDAADSFGDNWHDYQSADPEPDSVEYRDGAEA